MSLFYSFFSILLLSTSNALWAQERNSFQKYIEISRYASEILVEDEATSLMLANTTLSIDHDGVLPHITINLPQAQNLKVLVHKVRITDSKGNVIVKRNLAKESKNKTMMLTPSDISFKNQCTYPLTVEWEFKVLLEQVRGEYLWPSISGNFSRISFSGIRVFSENEFRNRIQTNLEPSAKLIDQSTGLSGQVWELNSYDGKKAWQNTKPISDPYFKVIF